MKVRNVEIILDNMSSFEFRRFMKKPIKKRWRILRKKARKDKL